MTSLFILAHTSHAQMDWSILKQAEIGKCYYTYQGGAAQNGSPLYFKMISPEYKWIRDSFRVSPALNPAYDTSNYSWVGVRLEHRERTGEWRKATISERCTQDKSAIGLCYLKTFRRDTVIRKKGFLSRDVLYTEGLKEGEYIPEVWTYYRRQVVTRPGSIEQIDKAEVQSIGSGALVSIPAGRWSDWEEVFCEFESYDHVTLRDLQRALVREGYELFISNVFGEKTQAALHDFQRKNGLPEGDLNNITYKKLGFKPHKLIRVEF